MNTGSEKQIERLEKHADRTLENSKYSVGRFDILIISLSSGGIVFSTSTIKDVHYVDHYAIVTQLQIAIILFGVAIITNLISQITSYVANKNEYLAVRNIIRQKKGNPMKGHQDRYNKIKKIFDYLTSASNIISFLLLVSGMILVTLFIFEHL